MVAPGPQGSVYMSRAVRVCSMPVLLVLLSVACRAGDSSVQQATSALVTEFETVFYTRADLISSSGAYKELSKRAADSLRVPFGFLAAGLDSLGKNSSARLLSNVDAAWVGAKDFRAPAGLGGVHSRLCYVLLLKNGSRFELKEIFSHGPSGKIGQATMWSWSADLGEFGEADRRPSTLYATQVGRFVLTSNDLGELRDVAAGLESKGTRKSDLADIRDWTTLNQHDFWGYRRYRHTGVSDPEAAGTSEVTPSAQALAFFADYKQKEGIVRLFASDKTTADKIDNTIVSHKAALSPFRATGSGSWQTEVALSGNERSSEGMFEIMSLFGFGVYL